MLKSQHEKINLFLIMRGETLSCELLRHVLNRARGDYTPAVCPATMSLAPAFFLELSLKVGERDREDQQLCPT